MRAKFVVIERLKGDMRAVSTLYSPNWGCGLEVTIGHDYLVFVQGRERTASLEYCAHARDLGQGWAGLKDDQLEAIRRHVGQRIEIPGRLNWLGTPPPPPPPKGQKGKRTACSP
ncbi:hypothetical protein [Pseudomonas sp. CGJS7]|uniref:hypothetical protein n=1 Tax=Pseudomonas sp. CGJS7 TaxID=3109348 RepID=UPI003008D2DE